MNEKKPKAERTHNYRNLFGKRTIQLGVLAIITILALLCALWNVMKMQDDLEQNTQACVDHYDDKAALIAFLNRKTDMLALQAA